MFCIIHAFVHYNGLNYIICVKLNVIMIYNILNDDHDLCRFN